MDALVVSGDGHRTRLEERLGLLVALDMQVESPFWMLPADVAALTMG